jgi:hypothetical protein
MTELDLILSPLHAGIRHHGLIDVHDVPVSAPARRELTSGPRCVTSSLSFRPRTLRDLTTPSFGSSTRFSLRPCDAGV